MSKRVYERKAIDMAGKIYGDLTVLRQAGHNKRGHALWLCLCACGKEHTTSRRDLLHPKSPTRSCGCFRRNLSRARMLARNNTPATTEEP